LTSSTATTELFAGNTSLTLDNTTGVALTSNLNINNATASNNKITQNIISKLLSIFKIEYDSSKI
jgi:hypothetical protein